MTVTTSGAHADEEPAGAAPSVPAAPPLQLTFPQPLVAPPPAPAPPPILRLDYNAPDPNRNALSHLRALANVAFANYAVFQYDWLTTQTWVYVTRDSLGTNLKVGPQWDTDKLPTNFFEHPYHGGLYFASARAAGLSFWESVPYTFLGSATWELFGETEPPSINDLIATSASGVVFGEVLYRLSSELLDDSSTGATRLFRELGAAVVSPTRGLNRLYSGAAWESGPPPEGGNALYGTLELGIDRLRTSSIAGKSRYTPTGLAALRFEYGDLLPKNGARTLKPFEYFEGYAAANMFDGPPSGAQAYMQGLLFGWSADVSHDEGDLRDNNVLGVVQSFDFQGADIAHFGCMSVGAGDYLVLRFAPRVRLRAGLDVDWTFLSGASTPFGSDGRSYNYGIGAALGTSLRLDLNRFGELGLRSKHYVTSIVGGQPGEEVIGYVRLWYGVDIVGPVGIGLSPTLVDRRSSYANGERAVGSSLETQFYLRIHD
jgi:hypothetical protein